MLYGIALTQEGRIAAGLDALRRSTLLSPEDPETHYNLAVQLLDQGDKQEAATSAREALRLDPHHSQSCGTNRQV